MLKELDGWLESCQKHPIKFVAEAVKGIAQVDFMPSVLCGFFFTAALFASGWEYGLYGLLGTAVSTATAYALGADRGRIAAGLEGFNGCLVATSYAVFLGADHLSTVLLAIGGCVTVVMVTEALAGILATWNIPTFTIPFCIMASAMTIAAPSFERVWHQGLGLSQLPKASSDATNLAWDDLWHAFFANVGQIFFMPQWYVGLLFLIGIFAACWVAGVMACVGSVVGIFTAWALGSPAAGVHQGLMGYNAVLVAMALCGVFIQVSGWSVTYAVIGAATATGLTAAMTNFFDTFGGHTFTWPFVLTALTFVAAVPALARLRRA